MERIFYLTNANDAVTNLPIYLFDTLYLPNPEDINYDEFIPLLLQQIPRNPFCLVMFSLGLNRISWLLGLKFLKRFLSDKMNMRNLQKIVTVHDLFMVKLLTQILTNYHLTMKNLSSLNKYIDVGSLNIVELFALYNANQVKLITCGNLSQLSNYFDITKLKISLAVYRHDLKLAPLEVARRFLPLLNPFTRIDYHTNTLFMHHFSQLLSIVDTHGCEVEGLFHRPGNLALTDILFQCINRNQLLWINDWDIYCIGGVIKKIINELPETLVPVAVIPLPVEDNLEYAKRVYMAIDALHSKRGWGYNRLIWELMGLALKLCKATEITQLNPGLLAKLLAHSLSHQVVSTLTKDLIAVVMRVLANIITNWDQIGCEVDVDPLGVEPTIAPPLPPRKQTSQELKINDLYNMSFDLTINDTSDDEHDLHEQLMMLTEVEEQDEEEIAEKQQQQPAGKLYQPPLFPDKPPSVKLARHLRNLSGTITKVPTHSRTRSLGLVLTDDLVLPTPLDNSQFLRIQLTSNLLLSSVDSALIGEILAVIQAKKKLSDVSNIVLEMPTHKYKVDATALRLPTQVKLTLPTQARVPPPVPAKKPVIRGRKVGQLAKLYEERCQGLEILRTM